MRRHRALLLLAALSATCLLAKTVIDYDHAVDFAKFHTWSWVSVDVQEPLWKDRVSHAIEGQLAAKGWHKVASGGDASVLAVGSTHTEQTLETWYGMGFGGGWLHRGWWGEAVPVETTVIRTPVGTLHVDIFDSRTKKVIWHVSASEALKGNPEKDEKQLNKEVADMFKKFPPTGK
jgi:hypothetical protein